VGNGLGFGAMKIARSMLEIAINAEFLRLSPEFLDDYLDWYLVDRFRLLNYVRSNTPHLLADYSKELQEEIEIEFQSVRHRFEVNGKVRQGWCSLGLDSRASKTDFKDAYKVIYPMGNKLLHGSISGMSMHATDKNTIRIPPPPSLAYCDSALLGAHMCAVGIVTTVSKATDKTPSPSVEVLKKDFGFAWNADAPQP
jgi:hypothetical protein